MATYTYEPALIGEYGKDRMRFELGDTMVHDGKLTCALCDEEYITILDGVESSKDWKKAKLACLESIMKRFMYEPDTKVGPMSLSLSERAKIWKEEYEALKKEIETRYVTVPKYGTSPDGREKPPYFYTGMMSIDGIGGRHI